jgi:hypothetical protein
VRQVHELDLIGFRPVNHGGRYQPLILGHAAPLNRLSLRNDNSGRVE